MALSRQRRDDGFKPRRVIGTRLRAGVALIGRCGNAWSVVLLACAATASAAQAGVWSRESVPGKGALFGISCPSRNACTAVGDVGVVSRRALAAGWNGIRWSIEQVPLPRGTTGSSIAAVSCPSGNACTAVGEFQTGHKQQHAFTLAEHWNGSRWAIMSTPTPQGLREGGFTGVSCTRADRCSATALYLNGAGNSEPIIERWNGRRWSIQPVAKLVGPHGATGQVLLFGMSCPAITACTAVGQGSPAAEQVLTAAERWDGRHWSLQTTPNPIGTLGSEFKAVSCPSARACWAVGGSTMPSSSPSSPPTDVPLVEDWNGNRWSIQRIPNPTLPGGSDLEGVSCRSTRACVAVGAGPSGLATVAEAWNGRRWSIQRTPSLPGESSGFFGVSCSAASTCTAVGTTDGSPLAERYS
jgi:hypothetical protein